MPRIDQTMYSSNWSCGFRLEDLFQFHRIKVYFDGENGKVNQDFTK